MHIPTRIKLNKSSKTLELGYANGEQFVLPAELFQKEKAQLAIYGDHASFAYWFYQPE